MRINKSLLAALAATLALGSCTDFTNGFDEKAHEYKENFVKQFGEIDPNQDWNMATRATATASVNVSGESRLAIYNIDPLKSVNGHLLGDTKLVNGHGSFKLDVPKNLSQVYVQVLQKGNRLVHGYCNVENGVLNISESSLHAKRLATRDGGDDGDGTTITKTKSYTQSSWEKDANEEICMLFPTQGEEQFVEQIMIKREEGESYIYFSPDVRTKPFRKIAHNVTTGCGYNMEYGGVCYYADGDHEAVKDHTNSDLWWPNWLEEDGNMLKFKSDITNGHNVHVSTTYRLNGDTYGDDVTWKIGDCKDLFWTDTPLAFFKESMDYRSTEKRALYEKQGVSLADLEKGVIFTTSKDDDQITIPMMYGVTQKDNILGYYYYEDDQDIREVNRYILFDDAQPHVNIKVDGKDLPNNNDMILQQMHTELGWTDNSIVTCKSHRLVYFGKNGELTNGTFNFPKGVHIGFFIRRQDGNDNADYSSNGVGEGGFAYSDPKLNEKYFYNPKGVLSYQAIWGYRSSGQSNTTGNSTRGNVKAITWNYNGRILVGFGDDTGDHDLNDFVFWVDGDFEEVPPLHIDTPDEVYEWMVACEDLGSTDDYDFNDVVFGIKHYTEGQTLDKDYVKVAATGTVSNETASTPITSTNYVMVTPYAAGGFLKSNITYNGTSIGEIHSLVNPSQKGSYASMESGKMPVLNADVYRYVGSPVIIELDADEEFSVATSDNGKKMGGFGITTIAVGGDTYADVIVAPEEGEVPQMLLLPDGWDWPTERTQIYDVYPDFENWTSDMTKNGWTANKASSGWVYNPHVTTATTPGGGSGSGEGTGSGSDSGEITPPVSKIDFPAGEQTLSFAEYTGNVDYATGHTNNHKIYIFDLSSYKVPTTGTTATLSVQVPGRTYQNIDLYTNQQYVTFVSTTGDGNSSATFNLTSEQVQALFTNGFFCYVDWQDAVTPENTVVKLTLSSGSSAKVRR